MHRSKHEMLEGQRNNGIAIKVSVSAILRKRHLDGRHARQMREFFFPRDKCRLLHYLPKPLVFPRQSCRRPPKNRVSYTVLIKSFLVIAKDLSFWPFSATIKKSPGPKAKTTSQFPPIFFISTRMFTPPNLFRIDSGIKQVPCSHGRSARKPQNFFP